MTEAAPEAATGRAPSDARGSLTLDRLMLELAREPVSTLTHARLLDLATRLDLEDELIMRRTAFSEAGYARNLVCRTPEVEVLVLCWRPGQQSTIHDHAGSLNAIRVHRGSLTSRLFAPVDGAAPGRGPVRLVAQDTVDAGELTGPDRDGVHQLANLSGGDLVTVHRYAPPLREVTIYSTDAPETAQLRLSYSDSDDLT